jgi:hypothetical protein
LMRGLQKYAKKKFHGGFFFKYTLSVEMQLDRLNKSENIFRIQY